MKTLFQAPIDDPDIDIGAVTLSLLDNWSAWVHRRVESVSLEDPVTFLRRISVDFTLHPTIPTSVASPEGPIYFVPLTLLRKDPLTRFSLTDESGRALPLLTSWRNGRLAAGCLFAAALSHVPEVVRSATDSKVPTRLGLQLWRIATEDAETALAYWDRLDNMTEVSDAAMAWRRHLADDEKFMALANDLARNFLVTLPLVGPPGTRRILKFAYEQRGEDTYLAWPQPAAGIRRAWVRGWSGGGVDPPSERPRRGRGALRVNQYLRRAVGWVPKTVALECPAASQGRSYHIEVEAPEGLQLTRAKLEAVDPKQGNVSRRTELRESVQRAHLYLSEVPQSLTAVTVVNLRPTSDSILRTAWLVAGFTTVVLLIVALGRSALLSNLSSVPGLLLLVPAGLAAYVARQREPAVTTSVLFGIRIVAAMSALWSFCAAALLIVGRSCHTHGHGIHMVRTCHSLGATEPLLWVLVGLSATTLWALSGTLTLVAYPPEQRRSS